MFSRKMLAVYIKAATERLLYGKKDSKKGAKYKANVEH